ncbi:MAG: tRNA pseudouridine(38-40) synthase TruA [Clostridia bacterium]|nr:tRNA pseudouridine(38-40) synthase TruA [Clostridia bacterium]
MRNIKLTIEYDGTNYHGWQIQSNAVSVQEVLEQAISKLTAEEISLTGCSRTDVGVHALGQVANFFTDSRIPPDRFSYALNRILPEDIVIKHSEEVCMDFHSRYWCKGKTYKYLIYNAAFPSALQRNRAYHVSHALDVEAMQQACAHIVGKHDFSAFRASGSDAKTSERTVYRLELCKRDELIEMQISGDGFLYNMVRIIAGTLIEVGTGKLRPDDIAVIIGEGDRRKAGRTAPAHGLYLVEVFY